MEELISNGVDIIKVERIEKILKRNRDSFLRKVFSDSELNILKNTGYSPQTIAAYFSVKESVMKSLGKGMDAVGFRDIEITKNESGKPDVILHGKAEKFAEELSIRKFLVSVSHEKEYAVSFVIAKK